MAKRYRSSDGFRLHSSAAGRTTKQDDGKVENGPVETIQVNPAVWLVALDLADGDTQRIVVRNENAVEVFNSRRQAKRLRRLITDEAIENSRTYEEMRRAQILHRR